MVTNLHTRVYVVSGCIHFCGASRPRACGEVSGRTQHGSGPGRRFNQATPPNSNPPYVCRSKYPVSFATWVEFQAVLMRRFLVYCLNSRWTIPTIAIGLVKERTTALKIWFFKPNRSCHISNSTSNSMSCASAQDPYMPCMHRHIKHMPDCCSFPFPCWQESVGHVWWTCKEFGCFLRSPCVSSIRGERCLIKNRVCHHNPSKYEKYQSLWTWLNQPLCSSDAQHLHCS